MYVLLDENKKRILTIGVGSEIGICTSRDNSISGTHWVEANLSCGESVIIAHAGLDICTRFLKLLHSSMMRDKGNTVDSLYQLALSTNS